MFDLKKIEELKKSIGQLFFVGLKGKSLSKEEKQFLVQKNIGGIILFKRNAESPEQLYNLCLEIQSLSFSLPSKSPFFIGIDMEGGRVQRLQPPFTLWPPLRLLGNTKDEKIAFKWSYFMGRELKAIGINLNFAPCLDVLTNPKNDVIGDRSLSHDPHQVARFGALLIHGYQESGILCCAKHFPGHGNTEIDSHKDLPIEERSLKELEERELIPFSKIIKSSLNMEMLMTAHIKFPKIDSHWPVTLSPFFLKNLLRKKLNYRGLIISDDLEMKAMSAHFKSSLTPLQALASGCDGLIYRSQKKAALAHKKIFKMLSSPPNEKTSLKYKALNYEPLSYESLFESLKRIENLKEKYLKNLIPPPFKKAMKVIGCKEHRALSNFVRNIKC